jgi:hypothetical protein
MLNDLRTNGHEICEGIGQERGDIMLHLDLLSIEKHFFTVLSGLISENEKYKNGYKVSLFKIHSLITELKQ